MWKVQTKAKLPNGFIFGYRLEDEKGRIMDIVASELINKIENTVKVADLTFERVCYDVGCAWKLVITDGNTYGIINWRTENKRCIAKEQLITQMKAGALIVTNCYLRNNSNGTTSIVCKNPEEIKRVAALDANCKDNFGD